MKEKKTIFPNGLHTIKDFLEGQKHQDGSPVGHQHTSQQVILPNRWHTKYFYTYLEGIEYAVTDPIQVRKEEYRTCAHILGKLNMAQ